MDLPEKITCVDCGQDADLLSHAPEKGWELGDIVAYALILWVGGILLISFGWKTGKQASA